MISFNIRFILLSGIIFVWLISLGWVYPEHREISMIAIYDLDPVRQKVLAELWKSARLGNEHRLNQFPADSTLGENPSHLDYAAWPAIAGDHSCSPELMLETILQSNWILDVADVAARLKNDLAKAGWERHKRINVLRDSDVNLQKVDRAYATRAGSNNVHFLLPRPDIKTDALTYLNSCLTEGAELNAIGAYSWFHLSALRKAEQLNNQDLSPEEHSALSRSILADEAFALHFIEDVFAAGHVAGSWGNVALRKGTHDYYNEMGLAVSTWNGRALVLVGDAWMRQEDAILAAEVARASLEQVLDAVKIQNEILENNLKVKENLAIPDTFNVCKVNSMPQRTVDLKYGEYLADILVTTPAPGLSEGLGDLPRFRSEIGPFMGIMSAVSAGTHSGGFVNQQSNVGGIGGIEMAFRIGFGIEGIINETGDGLFFLDLGLRQDAASTANIFDEEEASEFGNITATIPSRSAYLTRLRMPYWLLPLDLIIATPFLIFTSPETLTNMAVVAGNGGLIGWQNGIATSIGRFQFLLGREISVYFYGYGSKKDRGLAYYDKDGSSELLLIDIRTLRLNLPIIEYRPFRSFSTDQSSSLDLQISGGIEFPIHVSTVEPEGVPDPLVKNIYHISIRIAFDWRGYF